MIRSNIIIILRVIIEKGEKISMKKIIGAVISFILILSLTACGANESKKDSSSSSKQSSSAAVHKTTKSEKGLESAKVNKTKIFKYNHSEYDIAAKKVYNVSFEDTSWADTKIAIDKVEVLKTAKDYNYESDEDGTYPLQGFVRVHLAITPARDINIYPTKGLVVFNNNEQHNADSTENWDGEIASNATKDGWITFPIKNLNNISDLKSIRLKFDANYDTDDDDDENSSYDYDFTLTLEQ